MRFSAALLVAALPAVLATPTPVEVTSNLDRRATYVTDINKCPKLTKRKPTSVHDLRPDDFTVVMAVGDSITAGCFAKGIQTGLNVLQSLDEWRGISYAAGGEAGAITIPNLIKYYNGNVTGSSVDHHGVQLCFGPLCPIGPIGWTPNEDWFNAALSGSLATNLMHQVRDYLVPMVKLLGIPDSAYKYLNLQIGSNDLCQTCGGAVGTAVADAYEEDVKAALEYVRKYIPNVLVNVIGNIPVSQVYNLTVGQEYCRKILPLGPELNNLECTCIGLGQTTRDLMDKLQAQFDARLLKIVKEYQTAAYPTFAAVYQPLNIPLATFPVESLSDVDCFHPSAATHARVAAEAFNRMPLTKAEKATTFVYNSQVQIRCLEESDRILTKNEI